ncbi:MAG: hypothetical protein ACE1Z6_13145, partial [Candidatus Methylomirabilales bacterium]
FQAALLFDSLEAIAAAEPNRAVVLLQRAGSQVQLTRMVKQVEGLLGSHPDQKPKPPAKERASVGSDEPRR